VHSPGQCASKLPVGGSNPAGPIAQKLREDESASDDGSAAQRASRRAVVIWAVVAQIVAAGRGRDPESSSGWLDSLHCRDPVDAAVEGRDLADSTRLGARDEIRLGEVDSVELVDLERA